MGDFFIPVSEESYTSALYSRNIAIVTAQQSKKYDKNI
jgi:hypothetical protein